MPERIKAALSDNARASDVAALIADLTEDLRTAECDRFAHHARAIDVRSDDATADAAAEAETKAARRITRLSGQVEQLEARLAEIRDADTRRAREAAYAAFQAKRAQLAEELRTEWPLLEARMVSLLWRLVELDGKFTGATDSAESLARGCAASFWQNGIAIPRITSARLPNFLDCAPSAALSWPPQRQVLDRCIADPAEAARMVEAAAERVRSLAPTDAI
jgi:hypothetical protein